MIKGYIMKLATKNLAFRSSNYQKRFFIVDITAGIFRYVKNEEESKYEIDCNYNE